MNGMQAHREWEEWGAFGGISVFTHSLLPFARDLAQDSRAEACDPEPAIKPNQAPLTTAISSQVGKCPKWGNQSRIWVSVRRPGGRVSIICYIFNLGKIATVSRERSKIHIALYKHAVKDKAQPASLLYWNTMVLWLTLHALARY